MHKVSVRMVFTSKLKRLFTLVKQEHVECNRFIRSVCVYVSLELLRTHWQSCSSIVELGRYWILGELHRFIAMVA